MAVDGWGPDGSPRLICLSPPGGEEGAFEANVFLGYPWPLSQPADPALPSITPGAGDFSMELWARRKFGDSPGQDEQFWSGILENASGDTPAPIAAIRWSGTDNSAQLRFDALGEGAPGSITVTGTPTQQAQWSHYVGNFDRDGNMEFFIDGDSKGTAAIGAQSDSVTGEVHALTADHTFQFHDTSFDWTSASIFNVVVGPIAFHNRLMTNAEIQDSILNRKVQNLGSSVTLIHFGWRDIQGQTGWDLNWDSMMLGHKAALAVPAGAPLGAADTVTVRDLSGNDNHWTLRTLADYDNFTADFFSNEDGLWPLAFGADPYFR